MTSESKSRIVHENLDTTFVNLWALLRNLAQRGFIGRVRVELQDYTADVFLTGSSTPLVHEIDRAAGTDTLEEAALHRLVLRVRETPGTISVFEGPDEAVAPRSSATLVTETDAAESVRASQERSPLVHHAPVDQTATAPEAPMPLDTETKMISPAAPPSDVAEPSSPVEPAAPPTEAMDQIEWSAILRASGEVIGGIERALTGSGADFATLFDAARLELADDYTFLDPMSGAFVYANSVVTLTSEVPPGAYVIGLSEALRRVVAGVATGDRARRLRERVALELSSVARKRNEILDRSGFLPQLDRIAGTKVI